MRNNYSDKTGNYSVPRMDTTGAVYELRNCSARFYASYCNRSVYAKLLRPFLIDADSVFTEMIKRIGKLLLSFTSGKQLVIHDPGKTDSEKPFLFGILTPFFSEIAELGDCRLHRSKDDGKT